MNNVISLTASEARGKLYTLIREVAKGLRSYEIKLRGVEPVVIVNRADLESWLETLDILSNPSEAKAVRSAKSEKKLIPHQEALKSLGLVR
jgi:prevent-host-death family protein